MISDNLYTLTRTNSGLLVVIALLIIVFGGIGVYLVEHQKQDANITNLGDAFWWAVVTIATVGYGGYYPVTATSKQDLLNNALSIRPDI